MDSNYKPQLQSIIYIVLFFKYRLLTNYKQNEPIQAIDIDFWLKFDHISCALHG